MQIGVIYPQVELEPDRVLVRDFAQQAEQLGYAHISAYDHVLGANPDRPGGWRGRYTYEDAFLDPFALFSFMTGVTTNMHFMTRVLILPQRQTSVVAKQAATLDVLSGGQLTLGVGIGWNQVEYTALGEDFSTRGRRVEEQVHLLRELWSEPLVTFAGRWDQIPDAGIMPMPIQQPIPIWFGGHADPVIRRVARLGDGWMPNFPTAENARPELDKLDRYLEEAGRSRADLGLGVRITYGDADPGTWGDLIDAWRGAGATHLDLNLMESGFRAPDGHLNAMREFAEKLDLKAKSGEV